MSDCIPRVFDVTLHVPVHTRVEATDEEHAKRVALALKWRPNWSTGRDGLVFAVSSGFPESIEVKEVEQIART